MTKQVPYQEQYYAPCWSLKLRCVRYKTVMRTEIKEEQLDKQRLVLECCPGYTRGFNESTCQPVCQEQCIHGTCVRPDTCQCEEGFGGIDCSKCKIFNLPSFLIYKPIIIQFVSLVAGVQVVCARVHVRTEPRVTQCQEIVSALQGTREPRVTTRVSWDTMVRDAERSVGARTVSVENIWELRLK